MSIGYCYGTFLFDYREVRDSMIPSGPGHERVERNTNYLFGDINGNKAVDENEPMCGTTYTFSYYWDSAAGIDRHEADDRSFALGTAREFLSSLAQGYRESSVVKPNKRVDANFEAFVRGMSPAFSAKYQRVIAEARKSHDENAKIHARLKLEELGESCKRYVAYCSEFGCGHTVYGVLVDQIIRPAIEEARTHDVDLLQPLASLRQQLLELTPNVTPEERASARVEGGTLRAHVIRAIVYVESYLPRPTTE